MQPDHRMGKSCERCRGRDEHSFGEMDDQGKYFFKVMVGDFRHRMIIPNKIAQCLSGNIQRTIDLKTCNGKICTVVVVKYPNRMVLTEGWDAFVITHDLQMGDFLVFRYNGNSQFKVLIFDPSGCVKESSHVAADIGDHVKQRQGDPIEISSSSCDQKHMHSSTIERQNRLRKDGLSKSNKKMKIGSSEIPLDAFGDVSSSEDDQEIPTATGCFFSRFSNLTQMQRMKVEEKIQAVHSNIPLFVCVMKKCNITRHPRYLGFCKKYANDYLPHKDQMVMLQRQGKRWQVRFHTTKRDSKRLSGGWTEFASDNKLRIGDTCLFEILKHKKRCTMDVHIIRK